MPQRQTVCLRLQARRRSKPEGRQARQAALPHAGRPDRDGRRPLDAVAAPARRGGFRTPAELQKEYASAARRYTEIPVGDYFRAARAVPAAHMPRGYYEYSRPAVAEEGLPENTEVV